MFLVESAFEQQQGRSIAGRSMILITYHLGVLCASDGRIRMLRTL